MPHNFIGGVWFGKNIPDNVKLDVSKWNDMILVDRSYFLKNISLIKAWAEKMEEKELEQQ